MKEAEHLNHCLKRIEEVFDKSSHKEWTDGDFKKLARNIYAKSGTTISTHTLKRLFGKIKYKKIYNPQEATKNALAKYIGYDTWDDFILKHSQKTESTGFITPSNTRPKKKHELVQKILYVTAFVFMIASLAFLITMKRTNRIISTELKLNNYSGKVPLTVSFQMNTEDNKAGHLILNYNFVHPYLGGEYVITDKKDSIINYTYQIPGVYHPRLFSGNRLIDSSTVIAKTEGWVSFYHPELERHTYWLDNMYPFTPIKGYLSLEPSELINIGRNTNIVYYTSHRNIRNYQLDGDNYILETKVMNNPATGGISCYDVNLNVLCRHSSSSLRIVENDCHAYALLEFSDVRLEGLYDDLSFLTRKVDEWTILRIEVLDRKVDLFFNNQKIYSGEYNRAMGEILGIEYRFKGSGRVDYLHMMSPDGELLFVDEFGEKK